MIRRSPQRVWTGWRASVHRVLGRAREQLRGKDLALASAGSTLYGALAVVPSLLVAIAVSQVVLGRPAVVEYGNRLAGTLPTAMAAGEAARQLLEAGLTLSPVGVVLAVLRSTPTCPSHGAMTPASASARLRDVPLGADEHRRWR